MALPHPEGVWGRILIEAISAVVAMLRLARHLVVAFVAGTFAFGAVAPASSVSRHLEAPAPLLALAVGAPSLLPSALVSVEVDGLRLGSIPASGTVRDALLAVGIAANGTDRLSQPLDAKLVPGMRIAVDRGFPVTLIDGGRATIARSQPTTVGGFLSALALPVDHDDAVASPLERSLGPGDVVKVVRVHERELTEVATYEYRVRTIMDPTLDLGRRIVDVPGAVGEVSESYLVRYIDGVESDRTLLSTVLLRSPVNEIRRVGTRPYVPPPPPAEIEEIIRAAAERWGADPVQMIRVAWCESRYDPNAYNPRAGDSGLFQFIPTTWAANRGRAGYPDASPFDPVANANVAASLFARGSAALWTCR